MWRKPFIEDVSTEGMTDGATLLKPKPLDKRAGPMVSTNALLIRGLATTPDESWDRSLAAHPLKGCMTDPVLGKVINVGLIRSSCNCGVKYPDGLYLLLLSASFATAAGEKFLRRVSKFLVKG